MTRSYGSVKFDRCIHRRMMTLKDQNINIYIHHTIDHITKNKECWFHLVNILCPPFLTIINTFRASDMWQLPIPYSYDLHEWGNRSIINYCSPKWGDGNSRSLQVGVLCLPQVLFVSLPQILITDIESSIGCCVHRRWQLTRFLHTS